LGFREGVGGSFIVGAAAKAKMDVVPDPKLQSCTFSYTLSASTNILIGLLLAAGLGGGSLNKGFYIPLN